MPPKKKTNGFMIFTFEWKEKYGKHMSLANATTEAGRIWANMTAQERGPYNEKAKNDRISSRNTTEKLACNGVPLSFIEKEKLEQEQNTRAMKKYIEKVVHDSLKRNELKSQKYYFVMVNYFTKTLQGGVYIPAEISVCEYSFQDGLSNKFHSFINPGVNIYGHTYEAQNHSDTTHQLPLPPNALGEDQLGKLYNCILHFIRPNDGGEYPPLYTHRDSMPIVESAINFLRSDPESNNVDLKIYSIQYLLYTLKGVTSEIGETEKPASIYVSDAFFERDVFEYMIGIACDFHEHRDKTNYCTLSCVIRWCYTFSDYMAGDLAINCIPGRHVPLNTKTKPPTSSAACSDTESFVSMASESTNVTKPLSEHKVYYEESNASSSRGTAYNEEFPDLSGRSRKKTQPSPKTKDVSAYLDKDDEPVVNHWSRSLRNLPPQPDQSFFNVDLSERQNRMTDLNDADDTSSVASYGRGRFFKTGFGRGNSLHK